MFVVRSLYRLLSWGLGFVGAVFCVENCGGDVWVDIVVGVVSWG